MKKFILLALISICSFSACQKFVNCESSDNKVEKTFTAQCEAKLKTSLNNTSILWQSGDQISILWDGGSTTAVASPYNYNAYAEFKATVDEAPAYYAVYPSSAAKSASNGLFTITVADKQGGRFADANIICAKATEDYKLAFKHLVGYLEFTIDVPGLVTVSGGSNSYVGGDVVVTGFEGGIPKYTSSSTYQSVSVNVKASGTYYLAVLPEAKLDYLSIVLEDGSVKHHALSTNGIELKRGKIVGLGNITNKLKDKPLFPVYIEEFTSLDEFIF